MSAFAAGLRRLDEGPTAEGESMRAAVLHGIEDIRIEDVARPAAGPGELVIRVESCGICGSDAKIYYQGHREVTPPQIIGHEMAGTVVDAGAGVADVAEGDRINLTTEVTCGRCAACRTGRQNMCPNRVALGLEYPGGFAEYMRVPAAALRGGNVVRLPDSLPFDHAALIEPIACVVNAQRFLGIGIGDRVAILGAGAMGCIFLAIAKLAGASQTIVINASSRTRLERVMERIGADHAITAADGDPVGAVRELTDGGADVVIVAANAVAAQQQAIEMAAPQGRVCFFAGLPAGTTSVGLDSNRIHYSELTVYGAFSSRREDADTVVELMSSGRLDPGAFITHELVLDDVAAGIGLKRSGESIKPIVHPGAAR